MPNFGATSAILVGDNAAVLEEYNSVNYVKAVLMDNTSTNTGCEVRMVVCSS